MNLHLDEAYFHQPWMLVQNHIRGWGGREIDLFRGMSKEDAKDTDFGSESWIGSVTRVENVTEDNPDYGCSEVILPDGRQLYLYQAIEDNPLLALGARHMEKNGTGLGMLIKYLDAYKQYGLQCHPTRSWAKKMWDSDYGKEESWYVLGVRDDTEEPAYIYIGFKEGVTREDFEKYHDLEDINALENLCHKVIVKPGETYFVGGGCPHALGEGCFVLEVQEPSDITLGALPLHLWNPDASKEEEEIYRERLLGAYVYDGCDYEENLRRWRIEPKTIRIGDQYEEHYVIGPEQTAYFSFTELSVNGTVNLINTGFPQVAIITQGSGSLKFDGGTMPVKKADEIFIPFATQNVTAEGDMKIILCHPEGARSEDHV